MSTNDDNKPSFFARYIDSPEKERLELPTGSADFVSQWAQEASIQNFLMDILANGPVPTIVIEDRGTAHGFSKKQLRHARERMGIIAFKEKGKGKIHGHWFWTTTQHTPELARAIKSNARYARCLRDLSKTLGYRLQPIGTYPSPSANNEDGQK
jgi:hypothetical protein